MKQLTYRILLSREQEGGYTVSVPTLPGCITYGESIDKAITMAKELLDYTLRVWLLITSLCPMSLIHLNILYSGKLIQ